MKLTVIYRGDVYLAVQEVALDSPTKINGILAYGHADAEAQSQIVGEF